MRSEYTALLSNYCPVILMTIHLCIIFYTLFLANSTTKYKYLYPLFCIFYCFIIKFLPFYIDSDTS